MLSSTRILLAQWKNKAKKPKENQYPPQYEKILRGAKFKNHGAIREALAEVSIHVCDSSNLPPISRLAADGDKESVEFLKTHFNDSEAWAACGYAQALNFDALGGLIEQHPAHRDYILGEAVYGFVIAKKLDLARSVFIANPDIQGILTFYFGMGLGEIGDLLNANHLLQTSSSPKWALLPALAFGLGLKAHDFLFEEILLSNPDFKIYLLGRYICGLGIGGHEEEIFAVLDKHLQCRFALLEIVLEGLARSEKTDLISKILSAYPSTRKDLLIAQVKGFTAGGYFTRAETILNSNPGLFPQILPTIAYYLSMYKHVEKAQEFVGKYPQHQDDCIAGFAQSGLIEYVDAFGMTGTASFEIKHKLINSFGAALNYNQANSLLAKNQLHKHSLGVHLVAGYLGGGNIDLAKQLFEQLKVDEPLDFDQYEQIATAYAVLGSSLETENFIAMAPDDLQAELVLSVAETYAVGCYFDAAMDLLVFAPALCAQIMTAMASQLTPVLPSPIDILHLLATLHDQGFREELAHAYQRANPESQIVSLLPKAGKIHQVGKQYKLSYLQSTGWIQVECQLWHLQGIQLVKNKLLTDGIFLQISSYLVNVNQAALIELSKKQHHKFYRNTRSTPSLFATPEPPKPKPKISLLRADGKGYDLRKMR